MVRGLALLTIGLVAAAWPASATARTKDKEKDRADETVKSTPEILPRGVQLEFLPAAGICLPTLIFKCKLPGVGSTGPFVGGSFTIGFRAERHAMFGVSYSGVGLRPSYSLPDRVYEDFGHIHHVIGMFKIMLPLGKRFELGADLGAGWSYALFPIQGGGKAFSHGFAAKLSPQIDVYTGNHFFIGLKADFLLNVHAKVCLEGTTPPPPPMGVMPIEPDRCLKRNVPEAKSEQVPVHVVLPGIHFGVVI